jgi:hypothetical protein
LRVPPALEAQFGKHVSLSGIRFHHGTAAILAAISPPEVPATKSHKATAPVAYRFVRPRDGKGWILRVSTHVTGAKVTTRRQAGAIGFNPCPQPAASWWLGSTSLGPPQEEIRTSNPQPTEPRSPPPGLLPMTPDGDSGIPGKKPPATSVSRPQVMLTLREMRHQARIEGLNPDTWDEDDFAVIDSYAVIGSDTGKRVGRIYPEMIQGDQKWLWFLLAEPTPPSNSGIADSLDEAKAQFERRYQEFRGRT